MSPPARLVDVEDVESGNAPTSKSVEGASTTARPGTRPSFEDLPLRPGDPIASAWGLWGDDDELGTMNLITPAVTLAATKEVEHGIVIPLNLPLHVPLRPMNPARLPLEHHIHAKGYANDDSLTMNTQSSSHWDGPRHYPYQTTLQFYNSATQADISGSTASPRIGVQRIAQKGIATRGVLLDWYAWALAAGVIHEETYTPFEYHPIPLAELLATARAQGLPDDAFRLGDVLLVRTGFTAAYRALSATEQDALARRPHRAFVGVAGTRDVAAWHWACGFAGVASDTNAYEAWPPARDWGVSLHEVFLSGWGMPIAEVWDLEVLAERCREFGRWAFLLMSQPLNLEGGVASPANVMAVL